MDEPGGGESSQKADQSVSNGGNEGLKGAVRSFEDFCASPRILPWPGAPSFYSTPTVPVDEDEGLEVEDVDGGFVESVHYPAVGYEDTEYADSGGGNQDPGLNPAGVPFVQFDPVVLDTGLVGDTFDATGF